MHLCETLLEGRKQNSICISVTHMERIQLPELQNLNLTLETVSKLCKICKTSINRGQLTQLVRAQCYNAKIMDSIPIQARVFSKYQA